jgi:hypothetical protein
MTLVIYGPNPNADIRKRCTLDGLADIVPIGFIGGIMLGENPNIRPRYFSNEEVKEYTEGNVDISDLIKKKKSRAGYDLGLSLTTNKLNYGLIRHQGVPPRIDDYNLNHTNQDS